MKIYGYCRISRKTQDINRQIRNIKSIYPDAIIIQEAYTGTKIQGREKFERLCKTVKPGDMIVFDSVSRMSRNAEEGVKQYQKFFEDGITLVFLKEPQMNTQTYKTAIEKAIPMTGTAVDYILNGINQYLMILAKEQIRLAFGQAQKEVDDLHNRTSEGIETARLNGKQIGQRPGHKLHVKKADTAKEIIKKYSKDFDGSLDDQTCMKLAECSRNSYYKYKRELKGV